MKKTILGLCIGLIIGLSSNAFAAIGDKIEAAFAQFVFIVDGEEKTLDASPIVYNGTSYLPVRTVANLVGKDVTFKSDTKTIIFTSPVDEGGMNVSEAVYENPVPSGPSIQDQLAEIDRKITSYQKQIKAWKNVIVIAASEAEKLEMQSEIDRYTALVAELEARKAELLAQQ